MARRRQSLLLLGERADHERNEQFYTRHGVPLEQLVAEGAKLVFLCSPNNPTGNALDPAVVDGVPLPPTKRARRRDDAKADRMWTRPGGWMIHGAQMEPLSCPEPRRFAG